MTESASLAALGAANLLAGLRTALLDFLPTPRKALGAIEVGYGLKKMAETELAADESAVESSSDDSSLFDGTSPPEDPSTVLIVNDDRDFLKHLALLFQGNGFETLTAVSTHEAIDPFSQFTEGGRQVSGAVGFVAKPLDVDLL